MLKTLRTLPPAIPLALLMIMATALRLWRLETWPLTADEGWTRWMTDMHWDAMVANVLAYETHPPFYYSVIKLWSEMFGHSAMSLRAPSIIASVLLVPVSFGAARVVRVNPLVVASLAALSPPLVMAARDARPYALLALAFGCALWAVLRISRGQVTWRHWLGYAVAIEALMWLHALGVLFAGALGLGLLLALPRARWRLYVAVHLLVGVAWLPCLYILLVEHQHRGQGWLTFSWARVLPELTSGFLGAQILALGALAMVLAMLGSAAAIAREQHKAIVILLCATVVPPLLEIMLSVFVTPVFNPRYMLASAVPLWLVLTASIAHKTYGWIARWALGSLAVGMLVISVRVVTTAPDERWDAVAAFLNEHVANDDDIWSAPNDLPMYIGYAAALRAPVLALPAPFPAANYPGARPAGTNAVPAIDARSVQRAIAGARARHRHGVWIVTSNLPLFDPAGTLYAQLAAVAVHQGRDQDFGPAKIEHWELK